MNPPTNIPLSTIMAVVCKFYKISYDDLISSGKSRRHTIPRNVVMYLARRLTKLTTARIGERLGGRDHSTVVNGVKTATRDATNNPDFYVILTALEMKLLGTAMPETDRPAPFEYEVSANVEIEIFPDGDVSVYIAGAPIPSHLYPLWPNLRQWISDAHLERSRNG